MNCSLSILKGGEKAEERTNTREILTPNQNKSKSLKEHSITWGKEESNLKKETYLQKMLKPPGPGKEQQKPKAQGVSIPNTK